MDGDGKTWPLQIVLLLALIGGAVGLFEPQLFGAEAQAVAPQGPGTKPDHTVGWVLIAIAVLSAFVLYAPVLIETFGLRARIGTVNSPQAGTLLARMKTLEDLLGALGSVTNPTAGTLLARMKTLEDLLGALGSVTSPTAGSLLARIGSVGNPEDGTLLGRIKTLENLCQSREGSAG